MGVGDAPRALPGHPDALPAHANHRPEQPNALPEHPDACKSPPRAAECTQPLSFGIGRLTNSQKIYLLSSLNYVPRPACVWACLGGKGSPKVGILASAPELHFAAYMQYCQASWSSALPRKLVVFVRKIEQLSHGRLIRPQLKAHPRGREREGPKAELELPTRLAFNPLSPACTQGRVAVL